MSWFLPIEKLLQWGRPQAGPAFSQVPGGPVTFQWPQRHPLSPRQGQSSPGACPLFPVFLVSLLLGPVRGDYTLSKAGPPPTTAGTPSSDSLRGGGRGFFCLFNMGGLVWQERKLQTGDWEQWDRPPAVHETMGDGALACQWPALPTPRWVALENCFTPQLPLRD